jgi:hypothetical protein
MGIPYCLSLHSDAFCFAAGDLYVCLYADTFFAICECLYVDAYRIGDDNFFAFKENGLAPPRPLIFLIIILISFNSATFERGWNATFERGGMRLLSVGRNATNKY